MTNYERIKDMDKEEMSKFLCNLMCADCCENRCPASELCCTGHLGMRDWLEKESKEGERK
jgi:hypothetical protein